MRSNMQAVVFMSFGVLVCLASQTVGSNEPNEVQVFERDNFKDELTRQDMKDQLNRVEPQQVARVLAQTRDKSETKVTGGLTVDRLLAQNELSPSRCGRQDLRWRVATCERTRNFTNVYLYCRLCLVAAARYCTERRGALGVEEEPLGEANRAWQLGLAGVLQEHQQENEHPLETQRTPLERYIADDL